MKSNFRDFIVDILEERRKGRAASVIKGTLFCLSKVYGTAVQLRLKLYDSGIFRRKTLGCMVISVGNITVGGTGKTPVVEMLARALKEGGRKVVVLSRGYKSKESGLRRILRRKFGYAPKVISDGNKIFLDSLEAGDEPYMLANNLDGVPVLVDPNRVKAGGYAIKRFEADTLMLDDGFQYLPLRRKLDLVLIDCTSPFGNGRLLPRGFLREPLKNLSRANYIFLTKTAKQDLEPIKAKIRRFNSHAEIIETVHNPLYFENIHTGEHQPIDFVQGKKIYVFSAIARPESFEDALRDLGADVIDISRFIDHHRFTYDEIEQIMNRAEECKTDLIIVTEKDAVRIPRIEPVAVPIYLLRVNIKITAGARDFADCVSRICYS